jgi:hypothetical protein
MTRPEPTRLPEVRWPSAPAYRWYQARNGRIIEYVPVARDRRVLKRQAAVLGPEAAPHLSEACHGWRRGRGMGTGMVAAWQLVERVGGDVVAFDIRKAFRSVDQDVARKAVCRTVRTGWWHRMVPWLPPCGLPEGNPLAPIMMNITLARWDERYEADMVRYGDNVIIADDRCEEAIKHLGDLGFEVHEIGWGDRLSWCQHTLDEIGSLPWRMKVPAHT